MVRKRSGTKPGNGKWRCDMLKIIIVLIFLYHNVPLDIPESWQLVLRPVMEQTADSLQLTITKSACSWPWTTYVRHLREQRRHLAGMPYIWDASRLPPPQLVKFWIADVERALGS